MARCRNIKPDFFKNEDLADLPPLARILFAGLWCWADRSGRLLDRPRRIKAEILPYDDVDVDDLLDRLTVPPGMFIVRYRHEDVGYIEIPGFPAHQNPHKAEKKSDIPSSSECENSTSTVQEPCKDGSSRALTLLPSSLTLTPSIACTESDKPTSPPEVVVLTFPTVGTGAKTWDLLKSKVAEYEGSYPGLDVPSECRKALQWIRDNKTRRKTPGGMTKFLGGWMNRAQNSSVGAGNATGTTPPTRNMKPVPEVT